MKEKIIFVFRWFWGITGVAETLLGLIIVFFAGSLQHLLATGTLTEPLNLRILGAMDFCIGTWYVLLAVNPQSMGRLNLLTCLMRLVLSILFLVESLFLLDDIGLRIIYGVLAVFDLTLFGTQALYLRIKSYSSTVKATGASAFSGSSSAALSAAASSAAASETPLPGLR